MGKFVSGQVPDSSIATTVTAHALMAPTILQKCADNLAGTRERLTAGTDIREAPVDDAVAELVAVDGSTLR
ncbi:MAG: hypothetical protein WAX14_11515 [Rhodococcus sp. (in: high G+C Gram-positive bacteria)]|uniref:hypothetical protein n=1 Tax=Rhodococcus sp. TaxID=1831 RepID=UPI003BB5CB0E